MNIAFIQTKGGKASKASLEAAGFAAGIGDTVAVVSGDLNGDGGLGAVGVTRVLQGPDNLDDGQLAKSGGGSTARPIAPKVAAHTCLILIKVCVRSM